MRYLIHGYYGFGNFGDDLMLAAIVAAIRARDPGADILVKCCDPVPGLDLRVRFLEVDRIMEQKWSAPVRAAAYLRRLMRAVKDCDWLVIGGGALFLDKGWLNRLLVLMWLLVLHARLMLVIITNLPRRRRALCQAWRGGALRGLSRADVAGCVAFGTGCG